MKTAFLLPFLKIYGAIRTMVDFSNEMVDRGHEVTLYHSDGSPCSWLETKANTQPERAILEDDHDIAIANLRGATHLLSLCKSKVKVYLVSDRWSEFDTDYQRMLKSDWVKLAPTKWLQKWLAKRGTLSHYVPIGVNRDLFHPFKREQKEPESAFKLLWTGDKRRGKGAQIIHEMTKILDTRGFNFRLLSYSGRGLLQSEMAGAYGNADVFIDTVFGDAAVRDNPVLEAMTCGTPVLCSAHTSILEWAIHGESAYITKERDPALLADAVMLLKNNPELRKRLSEGALKSTSLFTWPRTVDTFEKIIAGEAQKKRSAGAELGQRYHEPFLANVLGALGPTQQSKEGLS